MATALSGSAQIAGKAGFTQGPAGFIKDVHQMERSPENVAFRGENKMVEQFYGNKEIENERIGEDLYRQTNPMHATAQVKLIDENSHVNAPPANSLGQQRLTAQHPGYVGLGNQQTNLDPSDAQIAAGPVRPRRWQHSCAGIPWLHCTPMYGPLPGASQADCGVARANRGQRRAALVHARQRGKLIAPAAAGPATCRAASPSWKTSPPSAPTTPITSNGWASKC